MTTLLRDLRLARIGGLLALALLAGLAVLGLRGGRALAAGKRPNVLVVMTDDQRADDMWVMRHVREDLAARGVTFERFYATVPLCCPSRVGFLTGDYAHNTNVTGNKADTGCGRSTVLGVDPLGTALQDAGYRTGYFGKYLNGYSGFAKADPSAIPPGWDRWFAFTHQIKGSTRIWSADDQGEIRTFRRYPTSVLGRKAGSYIERSARRGDPFFVTVATHSPHLDRPPTPPGIPNPRPAPRDLGAFAGIPLPQPPSFNERDVSDKPPFLRFPRLDSSQLTRLRKHYEGRLESLLSVDRMVHHLVGVLRQAGELRNTWIIFWSDNGYLLGEHRLMRKRVLYEEAARVPLVIRAPAGELPRGARRHQIAGNIDLAPTIYDITGVAPPGAEDGISLLPLARSRSAARKREILLENLSRTGVTSRQVRAPGWAYTEHDTDGDGAADAFELYDMRRDPYQLRNRYEASLDVARNPDLAAARARLAARLAALAHCAGHGPPDPCD